MPRRWTITCSIVTAMGVAAASTQAQWKTRWEYDGPLGPARWGALDSAYATCATGRAQSPIDIRSAVSAHLPPLRFENRSGPLRHLIDNGYTIRVDYAPTGSGDFLAIGGTRYELTQFHFHRPSEERVRGKAYDMEAHLMYAAPDGRVAGVTIFLTKGRENPVIQKLWDHMPSTVGKAADVPGVFIDPGQLLPGDLRYYVYDGSLTAPPCTEPVTWFVLKTPGQLSAAQEAAFATRYPHDVRPVMPLNGRVVKSSR